MGVEVWKGIERDEEESGGEYEVKWMGNESEGEGQRQCTYFYRNFSELTSMVQELKDISPQVQIINKKSTTKLFLVKQQV